MRELAAGEACSLVLPTRRHFDATCFMYRSVRRRVVLPLSAQGSLWIEFLRARRNLEPS
jgi:hypothetical protein